MKGRGSLSAKAVENLFERYAKTEQFQAEFQAALGQLTKGREKPFVVVIDELDRCRPSFALECLERIKHLFSAENVVFVLFWNSRSIHESVRHTYGAGTDAAAYLSKFVSLSLKLELLRRNHHGPESSYLPFIGKEMERTCGGYVDDFGSPLAAVAGALTASLRDVQKAIALFANAKRYGLDGSTVEFAYVALLHAIDPSRFAALLAYAPSAALAERERLPVSTPSSNPTHLDYISAHLTYRSNPDRYDEIAAQGGTPDREEDAALINLLGLRERGHNRLHLQIDRAGESIRSLLNSTRNRRRTG